MHNPTLQRLHSTNLPDFTKPSKLYYVESPRQRLPTDILVPIPSPISSPGLLSHITSSAKYTPPCQLYKSKLPDLCFAPPSVSTPTPLTPFSGAMSPRQRTPSPVNNNIKQRIQSTKTPSPAISHSSSSPGASTPPSKVTLSSAGRNELLPKSPIRRTGTPGGSIAKQIPPQSLPTSGRSPSLPYSRLVGLQSIPSPQSLSTASVSTPSSLPKHSTNLHRSIEYFTTQISAAYYIRHVDTSAVRYGFDPVKKMRGKSILEFILNIDNEIFHRHMTDVKSEPLATPRSSKVYRFRLSERRYVFVQSKSQMLKKVKHSESNSMTEVEDIIIVSRHTIIRDCEIHELKGSASTSLMKSLVQSNSRTVDQRTDLIIDTKRLSDAHGVSSGPPTAPLPKSSTDNMSPYPATQHINRTSIPPHHQVTAVDSDKSPSSKSEPYSETTLRFIMALSETTPHGSTKELEPASCSLKLPGSADIKPKLEYPQPVISNGQMPTDHLTTLPSSRTGIRKRRRRASRISQSEPDAKRPLTESVMSSSLRSPLSLYIPGSHDNPPSVEQVQTWTPGDQTAVDSLDSVLYDISDIKWERISPLAQLLSSPSSSAYKPRGDPFAGIATDNDVVPEDDINLEDLLGFQGSFNSQYKPSVSQPTTLRSTSIPIPIQQAPEPQAFVSISGQQRSHHSSTYNSTEPSLKQTLTSEVLSSVSIQQGTTSSSRVIEMPTQQQCSQAMMARPVHTNRHVKQQHCVAQIPPPQDSLLRRVMADSQPDIQVLSHGDGKYTPQKKLEQQASIPLSALSRNNSMPTLQDRFPHAGGFMSPQKSPLLQALTSTLDLQTTGIAVSQPMNPGSIYQNTNNNQALMARPRHNESRPQTPLMAPISERYNPVKLESPARQYHSGPIKQQRPLIRPSWQNMTSAVSRATPTFQNSPVVSCPPAHTPHAKLDNLFRNQLMSSCQTPTLLNTYPKRNTWDIDQLKSAGNGDTVQIISTDSRVNISAIQPADNKNSLLQQLLTEPE